MASKPLSILHRGENLLAYLALLLLALFPFLDVIARQFFHSDVRNSNAYLVHLVLVATFLAGAVTSRLKKHLSLSLELPIKEPYKSVVQAFVAVLCASITVAFAWSSLAFARNGFEPGKKVGIVPIRILLLVMVFGYLAMAVRFVTGLERRPWRGLWLFFSILFGSIIGYSSLVEVFAGVGGSVPSVLASLQAPLQEVMTLAATPLMIVLVVSAFFGSPIFVILGGIGYLLFARQAQPLGGMPASAYGMLTGYSIAAIPLFAIAGFILSESKAGERLVKLFRTLFAWFPGGLAIVAILVCAFFTTFTGASGVTILALGGLLSYILINGGYGSRFTIGLLTAAGSIGLLFPPSLPVIIYGVTAQINIKEMFKGGALPGLALILAMSVIGVVYALRNRVERNRFQPREALSAFRESIWEILLPLIIFIGYFGLGAAMVQRFAILAALILVFEALYGRERESPKLGQILLTILPLTAGFVLLFNHSHDSWIGIGLAAVVAAVYGFFIECSLRHSGPTRKEIRIFSRFAATTIGVLALLAIAASVTLQLVESAAIAVVYTLFVQMVIHGDLKIRDLPRILGKCLPIVGGVLTILALANGLSYYIIDAQVPMKLTAWVQAAVASKYIFLLLLNLVLLVVGCFLDIYSAILVVVPLIIPLGNLFGIHPVHLGVIFLANLELGYLTPPVGLNLYLSSYRFNEPVGRVARYSFKFLLVQLVTVLLITYVPFLTTLLLKK